MKEISKFCRIYCHRKWTELLPHIEYWLNNTASSATKYTPVELMFAAERPNLSQNYLPKLPEGEKKFEGVQEKIAKAYERMRQRANKSKSKRKQGNSTWKTRVNEKVLVKTQPISDAIAGRTGT
jgi:DNA repair ATPase RecN